MLFGMSAYAQIHVGAGYVNSVVTNAISENDVLSDRTYRGFYAGLGYTIPVALGISFTPGIYFESVSSNLVLENSAMISYSDDSEQFVDVPLLFSYGIDLAPGFRVLAFAGPTATLGVRSVSKFHTHILQFDYDTDEVITDYYADDGMKRFDLKVGGGLGLEVLNHICITVGYNWGLLDPRNVKLYQQPFNRNQFHAGISYLF